MVPEKESRPHGVRRWSGKEVRALREARRMSIREFAAHLGVSDRMVSKWEARGEHIRPRPTNQAALDTSLAQSGADTRARFEALLADGVQPTHASSPAPTTSPQQVRHPVDGKLMTRIEEGVYLSGPDRKPVWLPGYHIDVYPVTNDDYSRFVAATGHLPPPHWPDGNSPPELAEHPVVYVTWHDASAYAEWAGKTLPGVQEWEKAARGPRGDAYPWGDSPSPAKCNVRDTGPRRTTPVDTYHSGVSTYGVYDMCGNVWEWCCTEITPGRYELKGSAFTSPFSRAAPSAFNDASADMNDDDTGFRCATANM